MWMLTQAPSRRPRRLLLIALLLVSLPSAARAQRGTRHGIVTRPGAVASVVDPRASTDSVVVMTATRIRGEPSFSSLSVDGAVPGETYAIEAGSALGGQWVAIRYDLRTVFIPADAVTFRHAASENAPPSPVVAVNAEPSSASRAQSLSATLVPATTSVASTDESIGSTAPAVMPVVASRAPTGGQSAASTRPTISATPAAAASPRVAVTRPTTDKVSGAPGTTASVGIVATRSSAPVPAPSTPASNTRSPADAQTRTQSSVSATPAPGPTAPGSTHGLGLYTSLFGTATPYTVIASGERVVHYTGNALLFLHLGPLGVYAAPEFGVGAGHRSTMLGGGVGLEVLSQGALHLSALAGVTSYHESSTGEYAGAFPYATARAMSFGGVASIPFVGPARLAFRGQYIRGVGDHPQFRLVRHGLGLQF